MLQPEKSSYPTTSFGQCWPSSGHENVYEEKKLYSVRVLFSYTFSSPEDGQHWPKHVVVNTINKLHLVVF
jgi:hypothetical protein